MSELSQRLASLKAYSTKVDIETINKRIYNLELEEAYLKGLSVDKLLYVHVRLHNALSYKKPFASISRIKAVHDVLIKFLPKHGKIDALDG